MKFVRRGGSLVSQPFAHPGCPLRINIRVARRQLSSGSRTARTSFRLILETA